ncbi:MAG TPA: hypothetical protein PK857_01400 [Hyphomicrobium sp.]|nr:hypothetical protein [Hyphomicrobium sp.]HRO49449.1 hypothetical protein [Hyphomicrobium sp.]
MCNEDHGILPDIHAAGLGEMECEWLYLLRLHCTSYEHNRVDGLDSAISHAEKRFGADLGPGIAARIAVLVRAMRTERYGTFGYLSPHCPVCRKRITEDEWDLIALMRAGCQGDRSGIADAAAHFARRPEAPVLAGAAARFGMTAAALGRPETKAAARGGAMLH